MTDPRLEIYRHLPLYARMFDRRGVLLHFAEVMQLQYDIIDDLLQRREFIFHPDFVPREMIPFLGQLVGLAAADGHYLGIGINPEWPEAWQRDLLWRAISYWNCKGTDKGVRMAVSMWLRYDKPFQIYLPFGKRPMATPPRWFGYGSRYDHNWNKPFERQKVLGAGDYFHFQATNFTRLVASGYNWDFKTSYKKELKVSHKEPTKPTLSRIGPRNQWKHFYLTPEDWNQIFPDLHTLDMEMLPVLTRPTNFGWLSFHSSIKLRPIIDIDTVKQETRRHIDVDGHHYPDFYPILGNRQVKTRPISIEQTYTVPGNWLAATQYTTRMGRVERPSLTPKTETITKTTFQKGVWPAATYGDLPAAMPLPEGDAKEPLVEVLVKGNWVPVEYQRDLYSAARQKTKVVSQTSQLVGKSRQNTASYRDRYNSMPFWYAPAVARLQIQERTIQVLTGSRNYYSPTYWAFRPARRTPTTAIATEAAPPRTPRRVLGGYCYSARIVRATTTETQSSVGGNYRHCFTFTNPTPRHSPGEPGQTDTAVIYGANPRTAAQYGDRFPAVIYYQKTLITYAGNWSWAAHYNHAYGRPYYSPPRSTEDLVARSHSIHRSMPRDTYCGKSITYEYRDIPRLPYMTYGSCYGRAWFVPRKSIAYPVSIRLTGGSGSYYRFSQVRRKEPSLTNPQGRTRALSASYRYGSGRQWYFAPTHVKSTHTTALPPVFTGGLSYYAPARIKTVTEVKDLPELPEGFEPLPFFTQYYFPYQRRTVRFTSQRPDSSLRCVPGLKTKVLKGIETITIPGNASIPSRLVIKKNPSTSTGSNTFKVKSGIYPKNRSDWYPVLSRRQGELGQEVITVPAIPPIPGNQVLTKIQSQKTTRIIKTEVKGNGWGRPWSAPYVQIRIPELDVDWRMELTGALSSPIEMSFSVDIGNLAPVEFPEKEGTFIRRSDRNPVTPKDCWYFPAQLTVREIVEEIPAKYRLSKPSKVANYYGRFGRLASYHYLGTLGTAKFTQTRKKIGEFTVPAPMGYYFAAQLIPSQTKIEHPAKWALIRPATVATYRQQWGKLCPYDTRPRPTEAPRIETRPIYGTGRLCNVVNQFTTFRVQHWYDYVVDLPAVSLPPIGELYPGITAMNRSDNWTLILETKNSLIQVHPSSLFWTTATAELPHLNAHTATSFSKERGLTNLYVEFVVRLDLDELTQLFSVIVNCERKVIFTDRFVEPLNIHQSTVVGFKFLIQTDLMAKAQLA
jgi:hypothetical protein